jgi:hypothetical protein
LIQISIAAVSACDDGSTGVLDYLIDGCAIRLMDVQTVQGCTDEAA